MAAHKVSWLLVHKEIDDGIKVLHKCDNPACVRPDHLFLGTQKDNVDDMRRKGRANKAKGSEHPNAILTEKQVMEIRRKYVRYQKGSAASLAEEFGVTAGTITDAARRSWAHVK